MLTIGWTWRRLNRQVAPYSASNSLLEEGCSWITMGTLHIPPESKGLRCSFEVAELNRCSRSPIVQQLQHSIVSTKMSCATGLRHFILPAVNNLRTVADVPNVLGCNSSWAQTSRGRAGIKFGNAVMRYGGRRDAVVFVTGRNCRGLPRLLENRCLSNSRDSLLGCRIQNDGHCSSALQADSLRSGLSKEGTFSNVARLRASDELAENLEVAPVDVMRAKTLGKDGASSSTIFTNHVVAGAVRPDFRMVHATAVVHPDAVVGEGVEIGAFCTVGPKVKLGNDCKLHPGSHIFGETQLGERCVLLTGAVVGADIPGHTTLGDNNTVGYHAVVGVKCQDMKYKEGDECFLYIGNNNDIREFASIHRSSKPNDQTDLGSDNLIMGSCHIAHDCKIGNKNIFANGTLLGGHVVVEDLVHTGGAVAVHQFCNIGSYSFLAGGSMVDRDVPKFMMVAGDRAELRGLNLEGMRRCGFSDAEVRSIRRAYQRLFINSDSNAGGVEERLSALEMEIEEL